MSYKKQELVALSRAPGSTPCFGVLLVFCVVFLVVLILFLVCTMLHNVASVSGMSILDWPFYNIYYYLLKIS